MFTRFLIRRFWAICLLVSIPFQAPGHFVFLVPAPNGKTIRVVFSEDLEPDENVPIEKIAALKLSVISGEGTTSQADCKKGEHFLETEIVQMNPRMAFGKIIYGLRPNLDGKTSLLIYHPKVSFNFSTEKETPAGERATHELVSVKENGKTRFRFLVHGKPVSDAEGTALLPDGKKEKLKTDKVGLTPPFDKPGRYAIWMRQTEAKVGEHEGKKFDEIKNYATLVIDLP